MLPHNLDVVFFDHPCDEDTLQDSDISNTTNRNNINRQREERERETETDFIEKVTLVNINCY